MTPDTPEFREFRLCELFAWIERERKPGEGRLEAMRRIVIRAAMEDFAGNKTHAADFLGIQRRTIVADEKREAERRCGLRIVDRRRRKDCA